MSVTSLSSRRQQAAESVTWLSPEDVCKHIPGMTTAKLQNLRDAGCGPRYSKPTLKTVVYSLADVNAYVASKMVSTREQK